MTGLLGTAIVIVVAFLALLWMFQRWLIYIPFPSQVPGVEQILPGAEEVAFDTADGLRLHGWFLAAPPIPASGQTIPPGGGPAVLVFNGNAGNRSLRAPLARALAGAGLSVLLFDYRGYGGNPGMPTEAGLAADARAARQYLSSRPEVDPERIVFFGESLGAAVAVALAVEEPAAAIILRSPFTSLADVGRIHYPFLPVRTLLADRYPSIERIGQIRAPLLFVAGDRDRIIPPALTRRLFEAAGEPKELVLIAGADHNDYDLLAGDRMIEAIIAFLAGPANLPPRSGRGDIFLKGSPT